MGKGLIVNSSEDTAYAFPIHAPWRFTYQSLR